jgi:YD repeat-containing protein
VRSGRNPSSGNLKQVNDVPAGQVTDYTYDAEANRVSERSVLTGFKVLQSATKFRGHYEVPGTLY